MPYAGGVYTVPPGTTAVTLTPIDSSDYNAFVADIELAQNTARPIVAGGTGAITEIAAYDALNARGTAIASAGTINLDNATGPNLHITGVATITTVTLGTGKVREAIADGVFELTASANLIVNGSTSQSYTTAAGNLLIFIGDSSNVVRVFSLPYPATATVTGTNELYIPATAFTPQITNGAAPGITELGDKPLETLDFDTTTQEFCCIFIPLPKRWALGTVTAQFYWTTASGSGGVVWAMQGLAVSNDDAINGAYGTEQVIADTLLAAADLHITDETPAITIGGTPADADGIWIRVKRVPANGSDTLAVDARFIGMKLRYTVDQGNDA